MTFGMPTGNFTVLTTLLIAGLAVIVYTWYQRNRK